VNGSGSGFQLALAYLLYPLSGLDQAGLAVSLSDPAVFVKQFAASAEQTSQAGSGQVNPKILPGMNKFGDKSAGLYATIPVTGGVTRRLEVVAVRRGAVLEVYNSIYRDKTHPSMAIGDMVKVLDARVAAVPR
jgi:hypothetical protein